MHTKGKRNEIDAQTAEPFLVLPADPLRFYLPLEGHPQTITEAPISARTSADGMRRRCC